MSGRHESISAGAQRTQSSSGPPVQETVRVAVLPPRLPVDMAPPTGVGAAEAISYNESINWRHNESIDTDEGKQRRKSSRLVPSTIFAASRKPKNEDTPPFVFREVPYDVWRKHYAKNAQGRYKGTRAPAEDCLLLPEDVEKWRLGEAKTKADLWTRGSEALPVYAEAREDPDTAPAYMEDYTGPPPEEPRLGSVVSNANSDGMAERSRSTFTADGRTGDQIIQEATDRAAAKKSKKEGWKAALKKGVEFTMGNG